MKAVAPNKKDRDSWLVTSQQNTVLAASFRSWIFDADFARHPLRCKSLGAVLRIPDAALNRRSSAMFTLGGLRANFGSSFPWVLRLHGDVADNCWTARCLRAVLQEGGA